MPNMNKKGLSEIIGISIFILLSLIAVGIIYSSVNILAKTSTAGLSPFSSCLEIVQSSAPTFGAAQYNKEIQELSIEVKNSILEKGAISSFTFIFNMPDGSTKKYTCDSNPAVCSTCVMSEPGELKKFYFTFSRENLPDSVTLYINNNCQISSLSLNSL